MSGLVIFTGANSSLGFHAAETLLRNYPDYTVVFTVRDASASDVNSTQLREIIARFPRSKASILPLDLASLSATHAFADTIISGIKKGTYPPIASIIACAYYWNLVGDPEHTEDGYDKTFQVGFLSHAALVLRLLGSCGPSGRVVLISSDSHWPGKNSMEKYPPSIPEDMDLLINPTTDSDKQGRGYQRYATAKLALTTWMYILNRYLEKDAVLSKITVVAMNPGNLVDSRALRTNTPASMHRLQKYALKPLLPAFKLVMGPTLRTTIDAGPDVVHLALSPDYIGQRGYYTLLKKDDSSPDSTDQQVQQRLWDQTLKWANISSDNTALKAAFGLP